MPWGILFSSLYLKPNAFTKICLGIDKSRSTSTQTFFISGNSSWIIGLNISSVPLFFFFRDFQLFIHWLFFVWPLRWTLSLWSFSLILKIFTLAFHTFIFHTLSVELVLPQGPCNLQDDFIFIPQILSWFNSCFRSTSVLGFVVYHWGVFSHLPSFPKVFIPFGKCQFSFVQFHFGY